MVTMLCKTEKFYVEVEYNNPDNVISNIRAFRSVMLIDRFADHLDLSELF